MKILSIETSCDETAVSLVEACGEFESATFKVLGNALFSQAQIHAEYGGVYPTLAKREHAKNLVPLLLKVLEEAGDPYSAKSAERVAPEIEKLFTREPQLLEQFKKEVAALEKPAIDAMAVTSGPGLEPALWIGINFAKALSLLWDIPVIPVNHMEGHVLSSIMQPLKTSTYQLPEISFPAVALLVSGGHTELVGLQNWGLYELMGGTQDDAVGEAFDKVARMLGLPYPGGPEISRLAAKARNAKLKQPFTLPRPMLGKETLDFSFSGLKTAVLYLVRDMKILDETAKKQIAREFEDAAVEVLQKKTEAALLKCGVKTLIVGGGVSANSRLREVFEEKFTHVKLYIPSQELTTDNALMIAAAGYLRLKEGQRHDLSAIVADGNLKLDSAIAL